MTRTSLRTGRIFITMITLSLWPGSNALAANQEVITDDGREVLLKEDGTWVFRSIDRFANTKDGQRVRLKDDGSWQFMGYTPLASKEEIRTSDLHIKLQKVVIEQHETKVQKNKRVKTQTVFYLNLEVSPLAQSDVHITENNISMIEVKDNKGKNYPVLSIQPSPATIKPDSDTSIIIRTEGRLSGGKTLNR